MCEIISHAIITDKFKAKEIDAKIMAVYNCHATPRHATPELLPEYKITFIRSGNDNSFDYMTNGMRIFDPELLSRFVRDDVNPDYIVASDQCYTTRKDFLRLRDYMRRRKDSIFIFFNQECFEPDLNLFDYVYTCNPDMIFGDRVLHNGPPFVIPSADGHHKTRRNDLTLDGAREILASSPKFCNFIYSHECEPRDTFFHLLSQYKQVDSLGPHLHNTNTQTSRNAPNWGALSIEMKKGYKFSIAMENARSKGYTTEKIITSLRAHTVPIYWGDPAVADFINPKAFINCNDLSPEEVIERVKEIDNNDELWLDMVTQPWQTEEQIAKVAERMAEYDALVRNIFTQDLKSAKRVAVGQWPDNMRNGFTGIVGMLPPLHIRALRKIRGLVGKLFSKSTKTAIKRFLHMD